MAPTVETVAQTEPVDPFDVHTDAIWAGAQRPEEFNFGMPPMGVEASYEQDMQIRHAFIEHGVPAALGSQFGRMWHAAMASPPPDAIALELGQRACQAEMERMYGAEAQRVIDVARAEVCRIAKTTPQIFDMLDQSGLGNSPYLVSTLFNLARGKRRA